MLMLSTPSPKDHSSLNLHTWGPRHSYSQIKCVPRRYDAYIFDDGNNMRHFLRKSCT